MFKDATAEEAGLLLGSELGRDLGKLTATISAVMGTGIPDRDFGLEGMTRGQSEANQLLQRIIAKGGAA